jgi:hypothetical protein
MELEPYFFIPTYLLAIRWNEKIWLKFHLWYSMSNHANCITNFMGHNLAIIVMWNLFFIGFYGIMWMSFIYLYCFEHRCCVHCLDTNVICLFILFKHRCCMSVCVVYTWKLCTQLSYLNHAWLSCLNNMNLCNNRFDADLEQTHEAYKFVMWDQ